MNEENWEAGIFGIVADNSVRAHREVVRNQAPEPETVTGEPASEREEERKPTCWWLLIVTVMILGLAGGVDAGTVSLQTFGVGSIMAGAAFMASAGI